MFLHLLTINFFNLVIIVNFIPSHLAFIIFTVVILLLCCLHFYFCLLHFKFYFNTYFRPMIVFIILSSNFSFIVLPSNFNLFFYRYLIYLTLLMLAADIHPNPGPIRALYMNIRGLKANLREVSVASSSYDLIFCSETLVSNYRHVSELLIPNFNLINFYF